MEPNNTRERRDEIARRVIKALQEHTEQIWATLDAQEETARRVEEVHQELGQLLVQQRNGISILREVLYLLIDDATKSTMLVALARLENGVEGTG